MWVEPDSELIVSLWPDAPASSVVILDLLTAAYEQCLEFAPTLADGVEVPASYRIAQVMQARAIYRSLVAGGRDQIGGDGMTVTVFPLDWNVKALLRPSKGLPGVF